MNKESRARERKRRINGDRVSSLDFISNSKKTQMR